MIHWDGRGSGPLVLLAPYANSDPSVYDPLEAELVGDHRVMRYDDRGTGASDRAGPFDMETGADDLEAVLEQARAPGGVVTIGDAVHRAARHASRGDTASSSPFGSSLRRLIQCSRHRHDHRIQNVPNLGFGQRSEDTDHSFWAVLTCLFAESLELGERVPDRRLDLVAVGGHDFLSSGEVW